MQKFGVDGDDLLYFNRFPDINLLLGDTILNVLRKVMDDYKNVYVRLFSIEPGGRSFQMKIVLGDTSDLEVGFYYDFKYFYSRDGNHLTVGKLPYRARGSGPESLELGKKTDNIIYKLVNSIALIINDGPRVLLRGLTNHEIPEAERTIRRFMRGKSRSRSR